MLNDLFERAEVGVDENVSLPIKRFPKGEEFLDLTKGIRAL